MAEVTEMKTAAELNPQTPPPFVASTEGLQPPMDDNAVREIFAKAAASGAEDLTQVIQAPALPGQPVEPVQASAPSPGEVPAKFKKPDGTVDEEKLKASSAQLDQANEQKQKTIEEILAEYKEKERKQAELGDQLGGGEGAEEDGWPYLLCRVLPRSESPAGLRWEHRLLELPT